MPSLMQTAIPAVLVRGGTSKAIFLHEEDIPPPGELRDRVLKRLMGAPDPTHIDGVGGSRIVTSKIAIIRPSAREDADIDYTFAQVGLDEDHINYGSNCGNISSAVAPFAIDECIIKKSFRPGKSADHRLKAREVRIWQTGTQKLLVAHVPVCEKSGMALHDGDFEVAGVPGTGAPILMDFRKTVGASQRRGILPTQQPIDRVSVSGKMCDITVCDVGNICVFVRAEDLDVSGSEAADHLNDDKAFWHRVREVRGRAAKLLGMCQNWERVDDESPGLPMVVMVAPVLNKDEHRADVTLRLLLNNRCHDSMAGTGATCTAACSQVSGTIVSQALRKEIQGGVLRIQHPLGVMPFWVTPKDGGKYLLDNDAEVDAFDILAFVRTSRRIMEGRVYVPSHIWDGKLDR